MGKGTLRLPQIVALYVGSVLGSGILIIPGIAAEISGPASLGAWGIMVVLVFPMALTMGFLSAQYPDVGGVSFFVTKAFNAKLGSLIGWYFMMAVVVGAPVLALTGAGYLCAALGLGDAWRLAIAAAILFFGVLINYLGVKLTGQMQIAVVLTTLLVLLVTIAGSLTRIETANFIPFAPNGWISVGTTSTILFWCFIGWEAVTNISGEFKDPKRDAVRGTIIAAIIVNVIYFLTALVVVGTNSYGPKLSDASLVFIIKDSFGPSGAIIAGFAALFICIAPAIAYIGAAARSGYALAQNGLAPRFFLKTSKFNSPAGGLIFLIFCFVVLLFIFSTRILSMATLIQLPSAAFILTYVGGCVAGIKLLKGNPFGVFVSGVSLVLSVGVFLFVKWTVVYPLLITLIWWYFVKKAQKSEIL